MQISENLNSVTAVKFKVNQWTVRERFDLLLGRCRQQSSEEAKASGTSPEPTAYCQKKFLREKLVESMRESFSSKGVETDRKKTEMRSQALERLDETKKRPKKTVKEKRKGSKEAALILPNFHGKSQKRSLRSVKRSSPCTQEKLKTKQRSKRKCLKPRRL